MRLSVARRHTGNLGRARLDSRDEAVSEITVVAGSGLGHAVALELPEHHCPSRLDVVRGVDGSLGVEADMGDVDERAGGGRRDHRRREPLRGKSELLQLFGSSGAGIWQIE